MVDPPFEKQGNNAFKETGNVGIGTNDPLEKVHISDTNNAALLLTTDNNSGATSIRLENGLDINAHTHFNMVNDNDALTISRETELFNGIDITALKINSQLGLEVPFGLKIGSGAAIEEFSNGFIFFENSPTKVPTQSAVKSFVEQSIMISENRTLEKTLHLPFTAFERMTPPNNSTTNPIYNEDGVLLTTELIAPLFLLENANITSIKFYLRDNQGGSNFFIQLMKKSFIDSETPVAVCQIQASRNQPDVFTVSTATNITIDASSYYYFMADFSNGPSSDMAIIGAEIMYEE